MGRAPYIVCAVKCCRSPRAARPARGEADRSQILSGPMCAGHTPAHRQRRSRPGYRVGITAYYATLYRRHIQVETPGSVRPEVVPVVDGNDTEAGVCKSLKCPADTRLPCPSVWVDTGLRQRIECKQVSAAVRAWQACSPVRQVEVRHVATAPAAQQKWHLYRTCISCFCA